MSRILNQDCPYGPRSEADFLAEMNAWTRFHLDGCPEYARIWPHFESAGNLADLPWLHVGLFKHIEFKPSRALEREFGEIEFKASRVLERRV